MTQYALDIHLNVSTQFEDIKRSSELCVKMGRYPSISFGLYHHVKSLPTGKAKKCSFNSTDTELEKDLAVGVTVFLRDSSGISAARQINLKAVRKLFSQKKRDYNGSVRVDLVTRKRETVADISLRMRLKQVEISGQNSFDQVETLAHLGQKRLITDMHCTVSTQTICNAETQTNDSALISYNAKDPLIFHPNWKTVFHEHKGKQTSVIASLINRFGSAKFPVLASLNDEMQMLRYLAEMGDNTEIERTQDFSETQLSRRNLAAATAQRASSPYAEIVAREPTSLKSSYPYWFAVPKTTMSKIAEARKEAKSQLLSKRLVHKPAITQTRKVIQPSTRTVTPQRRHVQTFVRPKETEGQENHTIRGSRKVSKQFESAQNLLPQKEINRPQKLTTSLNLQQTETKRRQSLDNAINMEADDQVEENNIEENSHQVQPEKIDEDPPAYDDDFEQISNDGSESDFSAPQVSINYKNESSNEAISDSASKLTLQKSSPSVEKDEENTPFLDLGNGSGQSSPAQTITDAIEELPEDSFADQLINGARRLSDAAIQLNKSLHQKTRRSVDSANDRRASIKPELSDIADEESNVTSSDSISQRSIEESIHTESVSSYVPTLE